MSHMLRESFYKKAESDYGVSEECLKTLYIFIGSDGDGNTTAAASRHKRLQIYLRGHSDLKLPVKKEYCLCGNAIMENCYLVNKDTIEPVLVSGNCCMRAFMPPDALKKHCDRCGITHQNRKGNLCTPCRKFCLICDEPRSNKEDSLCRKHDSEIWKVWIESLCLITLKRVHKTCRGIKVYKYNAHLGDNSTVFTELLQFFDKLSINLNWPGLQLDLDNFEPEEVNSIQFLTSKVLEPGKFYMFTNLTVTINKYNSWDRKWNFTHIQVYSQNVSDESLLIRQAGMLEKAKLAEKRRVAANERKKRKQIEQDNLEVTSKKMRSSEDLVVIEPLPTQTSA